MEKQVRNFKVDYQLDWEYGVSIEQLEKDVKAMKELGVTEVDIEASVFYDCAELTIQPLQKRPETDEEYKKRIGEIKYREEERKRRDLEQLARLKEMYEK